MKVVCILSVLVAQVAADMNPGMFSSRQVMLKI